MVHDQLFIGFVFCNLFDTYEFGFQFCDFDTKHNIPLAGRLNTPNTVAALDLGGGSTQVTFALKDAHRTPLLADFMHTVSTPNAKIDVFTNSYLNLGLQAVRHAVYTAGETTDENRSVIFSECVNPIIDSKPFKYGTKVYNLSGKANAKSTKEKPVVDFDACVSLVKQKTMPLVNPKPITLNQNQISAFSYFFERAIENGLVRKYPSEIVSSYHAIHGSFI